MPKRPMADRPLCSRCDVPIEVVSGKQFSVTICGYLIEPAVLCDDCLEMMTGNNSEFTRGWKRYPIRICRDCDCYRAGKRRGVGGGVVVGFLLAVILVVAVLILQEVLR